MRGDTSVSELLQAGHDVYLHVTFACFSSRMRRAYLLLVLFVTACSPKQPSTLALMQIGATEQVPDDPDDPAIWFHPRDPSLNLIIATNKVEQPNGALFVFDMNGKVLQKIPGLGRPNNVDIEQGVRLGDRTYDLAITTERQASALQIYSIDSTTRTIAEIANPRVFENEEGDFAAPMGIALYKRTDGAVFAMVGRKSGPAEGYIWQYRLVPGPSLQLIRKFGKFSGAGEIEAITVDDELGCVLRR